MPNIETEKPCHWKDTRQPEFTLALTRSHTRARSREREETEREHSPGNDRTIHFKLLGKLTRIQHRTQVSGNVKFVETARAWRWRANTLPSHSPQVMTGRAHYLSNEVPPRPLLELDFTPLATRKEQVHDLIGFEWGCGDEGVWKRRTLWRIRSCVAVG